jgi:hypothetical protein
MRLALASSVLLLVGCAVDLKAVPPVTCTAQADCPPDQDCSASVCLRRACAAAADCGQAQELECLQGACFAVTCDTGCGVGYQCGTDGWCWPRTCTPTREGPPGDPSCSDGIDNDCDGLTDDEDPQCRACQRDADCDDGKQCNGRESCVSGHCLPGSAIICTPPAAPCQTAVCDESAPAASPCIVVAADDGSDCEPADKCTVNAACLSGSCVGSPKVCDDGIACTNDACDSTTGACGHVRNDNLCAAPTLCRPDCFAPPSGCGLAPASLALTCPATMAEAAGGSCTIDIGVADQAGCLTCTSTARATVPFYSTFDDGRGDCALGGWTFAATSACTDLDSTWCLSPPSVLAGVPALMADQAYCAAGEWVLTRPLDTTGLEAVDVCFRAASDGTDEADFVRLEVDPAGAGAWQQLVADAGGPTVSDAWLSTCVALPAAALGQPHAALRLTLHSSAPGHRLVVDDVVALASSAACSAAVELVTLTFDGCTTPGWTLVGTHACSGFAGQALEAESGAFTLSGTVDTRGHAGDVLLRFDLATQGATAADGLLVELEAAPGEWQTVFAVDGPPRTDAAYASLLVDLSAADPRARENAALGVRLTATSSAAGHRLDLDNVRLDVVAGTCAPAGLALGAPAAAAPGLYAVAVTATAVQPVQIECSWGSPPLTAAASVVITP